MFAASVRLILALIAIAAGAKGIYRHPRSRQAPTSTLSAYPITLWMRTSPRKRCIPSRGSSDKFAEGRFSASFRFVSRRAIAARGGARAWKKAASGSIAGRVTLPVVRDERTCPLLDGAGRCAVYAARPLGCRTFFCDRAEPAGKVKQREVNALVRRIQEIAARHEPDGDKGRPLTRAL